MPDEQSQRQMNALKISQARRRLNQEAETATRHRAHLMHAPGRQTSIHKLVHMHPGEEENEQPARRRAGRSQQPGSIADDHFAGGMGMRETTPRIGPSAVLFNLSTLAILLLSKFRSLYLSCGQ